MSRSQSSAPLHSTPLEPLAPSDASSPVPFPDPDVSVSVVTVVVPAFASVYVSPAAFDRSLCSRAIPQSIPGCSHHLWGTRAPPRRSVSSQSTRIGCVATNCAIVFCLRRTDVLALTIPASLVAPVRGRYSHFLSLPRRGIRPVSRLATLPWKASRAAYIFLVSTQVSAPKRRTCCVTAI